MNHLCFSFICCLKNYFFLGNTCYKDKFEKYYSIRQFAGTVPVSVPVHARTRNALMEVPQLWPYMEFVTKIK